MNIYKELLYWNRQAKLGEVGLANPGGVPNKYWPYFFIGNGRAEERTIVDMPIPLRSTYGHKSRGTNYEVHLEDFGVTTVKVNCCRKRHEISVLPNGRVILHDHQDDLEQRGVFQALIGMSGQTETRTRCEIIKDCFESFARTASKYTACAAMNKEYQLIPKDLQRVAVSRANVRVRASFTNHSNRNALQPYDSDNSDVHGRGRSWMKELIDCWDRTVAENCNLKADFDLTYSSGNSRTRSRFYHEIYKTRRFWTVHADQDSARALVLTRDPGFTKPPYRVLCFVNGRKEWGWESPANVYVRDIPGYWNEVEGAKNYGLHLGTDFVSTAGWMITNDKPESDAPFLR